MKNVQIKETSWGKVADWYDEMLQKKDDTYQKNVILPNILRMMGIRNGQIVLDLACGNGFFAREFFKKDAKVIGTDISPELIEIAKKILRKRLTTESCLLIILFQ